MNVKRFVVMLAVAIPLLLTVSVVCADPLRDLDNALRTIKEPIRDAASVNALVVSLQTDVLGKDDVRPPIDIRRTSEPVNKVSRKRDSVANACRHAAVVLKKPGLCWR